ncbi:PEP-CTERM sorting domain-containing protein [Singulisphaera acidiphila]|uniref:PEP-CTERM motif protein n=1 Tax=Singulisphaera acidiphila (strain ATCC BAA-1392 / DSM 18658 / VKM B-2454 / MOB10) TaxID=886293 RepID=L0D6P4_SINAD|nr:PEP-CTERM sorting domain-containing protein [Singulisphaera acidiphila]AGA24540.1 PEP-CTERM motif protein [Singulisphaera acidiphila DSM 18658]
MRMRWISTYIGPVFLTLLLNLTSIGLTAREAGAEPIRYVTSGQVNTDSPIIRFEGTEGTFEQGTLSDPSSFLLGRFVVDKPPSGSEATYNGGQFFITIEAPDFYQESGGGPGVSLTKINSSILIRGHIDYGVYVDMLDEKPGLFAMIDSIEYGSHNPVTLGHIQKYSFPITLEDMKFSDNMMTIMRGKDHFNPDSNVFISPPVMMETVPEPAAAWVFLAGIGVVGLYRRCTSQRIPRSGSSQP